MTDLIQRRVLSKPEQLINALRTVEACLTASYLFVHITGMIRGTDVLILPADEELPSIDAPKAPMGEGPSPEIIQSLCY